MEYITFKKKFQEKIVDRIIKRTKSDTVYGYFLPSSYINTITGGGFSAERYTEFYTNLIYDGWRKNRLSKKEAEGLVRVDIISEKELKKHSRRSRIKYYLNMLRTEED